MALQFQDNTGVNRTVAETTEVVPRALGANLAGRILVVGPDGNVTTTDTINGVGPGGSGGVIAQFVDNITSV